MHASMYRCEPATKLTNVCGFFPSPTSYRISVHNESEVILQSVVDLAHSKNNKCNQLVAFSACFYLFRNCELRNASDPSSGVQLRICQNKCPGLTQLIYECIDADNFQTVIEDSNYNEAVLELVDWALNFSCHNLSTYILPKVPISNTLCDNISFIDDLLPSESGGELKIIIIDVLL